MMMLKIKNIKNYFNIFSNKKYFEKYLAIYTNDYLKIL